MDAVGFEAEALAVRIAFPRNLQGSNMLNICCVADRCWMYCCTSGMLRVCMPGCLTEITVRAGASTVNCTSHQRYARCAHYAPIGFELTVGLANTGSDGIDGAEHSAATWQVSQQWHSVLSHQPVALLLISKNQQGSDQHALMVVSGADFCSLYDTQ